MRKRRKKTPIYDWEMDNYDAFDADNSGRQGNEENTPFDTDFIFDFEQNKKKGKPKNKFPDAFLTDDYIEIEPKRKEEANWDADEPQEKTPRVRRRKKNNGGWIVAIALVLALVMAAGFAVWFLQERDIGYPVERDPSEQTMPAQTVPPVVTLPEATSPTVTLLESPSAVGQSDPVTGAVYYVRSVLDPVDQLIYDQIYAGAMTMESVISLNCNDMDHVFEIKDYVLMDHPELFWMEGACAATEYDDHVELNLEYTHTAEERAAVQAALDDYTQKALTGLQGLSQYEQVKGVYEYIINHTDYQSAYDAQSVCDIVLEGKAVCAGYAKLTQYLLQKLGMEVFYVSGMGEGESHAWNIVKVEGAYYQLDTTWGDPVRKKGEDPSLNYRYFCLTSQEMYKDHTVDRNLKIALPDCSATACNYYVRENRYFQSYDRSKLKALVQADVAARRNCEIKFANASVFHQAVSTLIDNYEMFRILEENNETLRYKDSWVYSKDEEMNVLTIMFDYGK